MDYQSHRDMDEMAVWADQHRTECRRVFAPIQRGNSSGNKAVDFATFWQIRLPLFVRRIDWAWIAVGACMVTVLVGLLGVADSLDWINVAKLFGSKS